MLNLDDTYIPPLARNQDLSDQLVKAALEFACENNYQAIPSCPVVEVYVKRHPEYKDLLSE